MHADIINTSSNNTDSTDSFIYIIAGSVVGSISIILVVCVLFIPVMIYLNILRCHAKKDDVSSRDRPDVPVYECITDPIYNNLNPTAITSVMTENEAYNIFPNEIRVYNII